MILSPKDIVFIIEAIENQIGTYQERMHAAENTENEDEAADLGNDIEFLKCLLRDFQNNLKAHRDCGDRSPA